MSGTATQHSVPSIRGDEEEAGDVPCGIYAPRRRLVGAADGDEPVTVAEGVGGLEGAEDAADVGDGDAGDSEASGVAGVLAGARAGAQEGERF